MSYNIQYFGSSHDPEVGLIAEGLPAGEEIDMAVLDAFLARRRPGQGPDVTQRREPDIPIFKSGIKDNKTDGNPIHIVIENKDIDDKDYEAIRDIPRPGHADYTAYLKYGEIPLGGGQFSARMTAPTCVLGGICMQILERRGIGVHADIKEIGDIDKARAEKDSVGGIITATITGVPAGIGGPMSQGIESRLSAALFAIPAVKGVEFGDGFALASMTGSEANDAYYIDDGKVVMRTNHCGGILGGISNGMPIVLNVAMKPTPSIGKVQDSINLRTMTETKLEISGRHDPTVVIRALPVIEAVCAITILEMLEEDNSNG